jgi:predicted  nucleic acid-binding Zn-ribbon protein
MSSLTRDLPTGTIRDRIEGLERNLRIMRGERDHAIDQARINADTIESQKVAYKEAISDLHAKLGHAEKEVRELKEKLATSVVDLNDKWRSHVSLQQILDDGLYETEAR